MKETLKFVIVGHVDHGKSTLIGRLLYDTNSLPEGKIEEIKSVCKELGKDLEFGYLMDHLQEEREQGVTIDTTQTFFKTKKRDYVIIDAPGHREFIKNMITGASQAEAAILIVDVNEGVQEQTKRHAYILGMLGLRQVIVAMNKMDLVGYEKGEFTAVKKGLLDFLSSIKIKPSYIIPISAKEGDNIAKKSGKIPWYRGVTVLEALNTFKSMGNSRNKALRFPVQDVYKFRDKKIIVGKVESGTLRKGDNILILPSGRETKVKSIEEYQKQSKKAEAGKSIGITTEDALSIERGNVIIHKDDSALITNKIKAHVFWMNKKPLHGGEKILFRCATQEVMCEVKKIIKVVDSSSFNLLGENVEKIKNMEVADIIIKTENPIVVENFNDVRELGRFILQRTDTCAGGIITEI